MNAPSDPAGEPGSADQSGQTHREPETTAKPPHSEATGSSDLETAWVVLATFPNSHAAERMISKLGGEFRRKARHGQVAAFVVTGDRHGSFRLVQSRMITASGLAAAGVGVSVATLAGFNGLISALKGAKTGAGSVRTQHRHVGGGADRVREMVGQAGEHGAILAMRCADHETAQTVEGRVAERATDHWLLSRTEFLAALDRLGSEYDWARPTVDDPAHKRR